MLQAQTPASPFYSLLPEEIEIVSKRRTHNPQKGQVLFAGEIEMKAGQMWVRCDGLTATGELSSERKTKPLVTLSSLEAQGNVRLSHPDGFVTAQRALYDPSQRRINVEGNPAIFWGTGDTLQAQQIQWDLSSGEITLHNAHGRLVRSLAPKR